MAEVVRALENEIITFKHINNLIKAKNVYECSQGVIYATYSENIENYELFDKIRKYANEHNIDIVDYEDWIKFVKNIDNKK